MAWRETLVEVVVTLLNIAAVVGFGLLYAGGIQ